MGRLLAKASSESGTISTPFPSSATAISVSYWFKHTSAPSTGASSQTGICCRNAAGSIFNFYAVHGGSSVANQFRFGWTNAGVVQEATAPYTFDTTNLHHIMVSWDWVNQVVIATVDGQPLTITATGLTWTPQTGQTSASFGDAGTGQHKFFDGVVAEIAIWQDVALQVPDGIALANGLNPERVQGANLRWHWSALSNVLSNLDEGVVFGNRSTLNWTSTTKNSPINPFVESIFDWPLEALKSGITVTLNCALPFELLAVRTLDGPAPLELVSRLQADAVDTLELLSTARANGATPMELRATVTFDGVVPLELLGELAVAMDGAAPIELLDGVRVDFATPLESLRLVPADSPAALEFLAGLAADAVAPLELIGTGIVARLYGVTAGPNLSTERGAVHLKAKGVGVAGQENIPQDDPVQFPTSF